KLFVRLAQFREDEQGNKVNGYKTHINVLDTKMAELETFTLPPRLSHKNGFQRIYGQLLRSLELAGRFAFTAKVYQEKVSWECKRTTTDIIEITVVDRYLRWGFAKQMNSQRNIVETIEGNLLLAARQLEQKNNFQALITFSTQTALEKRKKEEQPENTAITHIDKYVSILQEIQPVQVGLLFEGGEKLTFKQIPVQGEELESWMKIIAEGLSQKFALNVRFSVQFSETVSSVEPSPQANYLGTMKVVVSRR
ncbi:hypothetical protein HN958_03485, partial [Candidatus Falkowbacteria bacterium]|nr:hypothetical protein [Candidatus Falkowbacteria bacterium]